MKANWEQQKEEIMEELTDSITSDLMSHAVITPSGNSYEKGALKEWMEDRKKRTDPLTNTIIQRADVIENHALSKITKLFSPPQPSMIFSEFEAADEQKLRAIANKTPSQRAWLIRESATTLGMLAITFSPPDKDGSNNIRLSFTDDGQCVANRKNIFPCDRPLEKKELNSLFKKIKELGFNEKNQLLPTAGRETKKERFEGCTAQAFSDHLKEQQALQEHYLREEEKLVQEHQITLQPFENLVKKLINCFPETGSNWKSYFGDHPPTQSRSEEHDKAQTISNLASHIKDLRRHLTYDTTDLASAKIEIAGEIQKVIDATAQGPQKSGFKKFLGIDTTTEKNLKRFLKEEGLDKLLAEPHQHSSRNNRR